MTEAAQTVDFTLTVKGDQESAAKVDRVAKSFKKLEQGGTDVGKSLNAAGERIAKVSSLLATADPVIGKLTGTMSKAAGAAGTLSMAIGGPAGLIAGGLIAAVSLLSDVMDEQEKKTQTMVRGFQEGGRAAITFASALAKINEREDKAALAKRLQSGDASAAEFEAQITALSNDLSTRQKNKTGISQFDRAQAAEIERLRVGLENAKAREAISGSAASAEKFGQIGSASGGGSKAESGQSAAALQLDQLRQQGEERKRINANTMEFLQNLQAEDTARFKSDLKLKNEFEAEESKRQADMLVEIKRAQLAEQERLEQAQFAKDEARRMVVTAGLQNVAGNTVSALQKVAKGQKMTTAMFLESIGDTTVASGTSHILQGVALSVVNPAQGVPLVAAGAAEVAFGIGLGAAASRGSGGSASNSGRGGGRAAAGGFGAEPTRSRMFDDTAQTTTRSAIVVNVNANVVDDNAGVIIARSLEEAQRKRGLTLSREVVGRV